MIAVLFQRFFVKWEVSDKKHCPNLVRSLQFFRCTGTDGRMSLEWELYRIGDFERVEGEWCLGSLGKNYESSNLTNTLRTPAMEPENEPFPKENHHPSLHFWVPDVCFHGCAIERKGPSKRDELSNLKSWKSDPFKNGQTWKAGEEVTISYGEQSQDMTVAFHLKSLGKLSVGRCGVGRLEITDNNGIERCMGFQHGFVEFKRL